MITGFLVNETLYNILKGNNIFGNIPVTCVNAKKSTNKKKKKRNKIK